MGPKGREAFFRAYEMIPAVRRNHVRNRSPSPGKAVRREGVLTSCVCRAYWWAGRLEGSGRASGLAPKTGGANACKELAEKFKAEYGVDYKVVRADLSEPDEACEKIFAATEDLDMGFMSYVACLHHFGRFQEVDLETHEKCLNVNVITFLRIFHHYMKDFAAKDRGAVINVSSMTGISGSPFNGEYGAGKAYILKLTEAVAYETKKTGVDVEAITLGTTLTPTAMKNFPKGPAGDAVVKIALTPDQVADEAFEKLGREMSVIAGERNKASVHDWKANHTEDEYIAYMGAFYEN